MTKNNSKQIDEENVFEKLKYILKPKKKHVLKKHLKIIISILIGCILGSGFIILFEFIKNR